MTIALAALLLLAQPSVSPGDVGCIVESTSPADRQAMMAAGFSGEVLEQLALERLIAAVDACQGVSAWNEDRRVAATAAAMATIIREDSIASLTAAGIAPRNIDRWFNRQDSNVRTNLAIAEADAARLLDSLQADGASAPAIEAQAHLIGVYFGTLILLERIALGLPIE